MSNKGELTGLRCKLVKLPLLFNGSKLDWFFSEPYILEDPGMVVSKVEKNGSETHFSRTDEKAPAFSPGDPGVESRVTKKDGEVRYDR